MTPHEHTLAPLLGHPEPAPPDHADHPGEAPPAGDAEPTASRLGDHGPAPADGAKPVRAGLGRRRGVLLLVPALALAILSGVLLGRAVSADPAPPAPRSAAPNVRDLALRQQLPHVLGALNQARISGRASLAHAGTPGRQARAARTLARAHAAAAETLRLVTGAAGAALADRLSATADAYGDLAQAAATGSAPAFAAARREVERSEAGVRRALPTDPKPAARPAAAGSDSGPTRLALLAVMLFFALLGAGLALLRLPERLIAARGTARRAKRAPLGLQTPAAGPAPAAGGPEPATVASIPAPSTPRDGAATRAPQHAPAPVAPRRPARPAKAAERRTRAQAARPPARPSHAGSAGATRERGAPAAFPPETGWSCEIAWSANLRNAGFRALAVAPGRRPRLIARSPDVSWPPLFPPLPHDDVVAAARLLVRRMRDAGWTPVRRGDSWYAQRFVWRGEDDPQPLGR